MSMGFAPTWLRQVSPLLHKTTLTTGIVVYMFNADCHVGVVYQLATAVQLHVKWSCKHKFQLQTAQRLMFRLNSE